MVPKWCFYQPLQSEQFRTFGLVNRFWSKRVVVISVILKYTFGAIAPVIGTSTLVSPFLVFAQSVCTTFDPFSIEIKARPPSLDGKEYFGIFTHSIISLYQLKNATYLLSQHLYFSFFQTTLANRYLPLNAVACPSFGI